jgi:hypothetical protein
MPVPKPNRDENKQAFVSRCMSNDTMKKEYPDSKQRAAICLGQTRGSVSDHVFEILNLSLSCNDCENDDSEEINIANLVPPKQEDYVDFGEETEELILPSTAAYEYIDPVTYEKYYFERKGNYKKDGRYLRYEGKTQSSEYQGRKVTLNKPFRTPGGPKKMSVYVKNDKGNVVKVNFGDPNMKIKKNIPSRRKSFRARHNCDNPGPKWKARYWSCKAW